MIRPCPIGGLVERTLGGHQTGRATTRRQAGSHGQAVSACTLWDVRAGGKERRWVAATLKEL